METIDDIVREMRGQGGDDGYPLDIKRFADRIDAALKRERAQHAAVLRAQIDEVQRCAVYKEALKPVLNVNADEGDVLATALACKGACRESLRILREGMEACE